MANFDSLDLISKSRSAGNFGNASVFSGKATPLTEPTSTAPDVIRTSKVPGGIEAHRLTVINGEMDTGTALLVDIGYAPVDPAIGPAADSTFFATAATILQGAATTVYNFDPFLLTEDVFITFTIDTDATTFASVAVGTVLEGKLVGIK